MDLILEVVDQYAFDYAYAYLLPAKSIEVSSEFLANGANRTAEIIGNAWSYTPASTYLWSMIPTAAAYESAWPRDYIVRQFLSLWAITWYVSSPQFLYRVKTHQLTYA